MLEVSACNTLYNMICVFISGLNVLTVSRWVSPRMQLFLQPWKKVSCEKSCCSYSMARLVPIKHAKYHTNNRIANIVYS